MKDTILSSTVRQLEYSLYTGKGTYEDMARLLRYYEAAGCKAQVARIRKIMRGRAENHILRNVLLHLQNLSLMML